MKNLVTLNDILEAVTNYAEAEVETVWRLGAFDSSRGTVVEGWTWDYRTVREFLENVPELDEVSRFGVTAFSVYDNPEYPEKLTRNEFYWVCEKQADGTWKERNAYYM